MNLAKLPHAEQIQLILTASPEAIKAAWQRHQSAKANAARWAKSRPPQCPCGAMTAARAAKRGHRCEAPDAGLYVATQRRQTQTDKDAVAAVAEKHLRRYSDE